MFSLAFAAHETSKESYSKGETISVSGECFDNVSISISSLGRQIIGQDIACQNSAFAFDYEIQFYDPVGIWRIKSLEGAKEDSSTVSVKHVRESQFYLITFLSPAKESFYRKEMVNISARIQDAGANVEDAEVFTWLPTGEKVVLAHRGEGVYGIDYEISANERIGPWKITVSAKKESDAGVFGGENSTTVRVDKAPIIVDLVKPNTKGFSLGTDIEVEINVSYEDGSTPENISATVFFDGTETEMAGQGNGIFTHSIPLTKEDLGIKKIIVTVSDEFENETMLVHEITVSESIFSLAMDLAPYLVAILIVLVVVAVVVVPRFREKQDVSSLAKRQKLLDSKVIKLQTDYFTKGTLSKTVYDKKIAKYEVELREIKKKLKIR